VVRGDVRRLVCDAWLLPTDSDLAVERPWFEPPPSASTATLAWLDRLRAEVLGAPPFAGDELARALDARAASGAVPVLVRTATTHVSVDREHLARALRAFTDVALAAPRTGAAALRRTPLLAVPAVGTGAGGGASLRGEVLQGLLDLLDDVAEDADVDLALVVRTDAMAAALREHRRHGEHRQEFDDALGPELVSAASELADRVRRGEVVLFTGAGTGVPAGLPTWDGLLRELASDGGRMLDDDEGMRHLSALDKATIIERELGRDRLVAAICEAVSTDGYAIGHALLANLPVRESATLNYDELLETAAADAGRRIAVLPYERPDEAFDGWLLKMHGCVREDRRRDIVLTREDYLSVGQHRAALTGLLQAMLVTKHLLFVGFGLTDEHFHAVMHDARRALQGADGRVAQVFGTALLLDRQPAAELVWKDSLVLLPVGGGDHDDPGRRLEILLDWLANESDQGWQHVLDDTFASTLDEGLLALRGLLQQLEGLQEPLSQGGAWPAVATLLQHFGWEPDR
jgi:hypothetical protein